MSTMRTFNVEGCMVALNVGTSRCTWKALAQLRPDCAGPSAAFLGTGCQVPQCRLKHRHEDHHMYLGTQNHQACFHLVRRARPSWSQSGVLLSRRAASVTKALGSSSRGSVILVLSTTDVFLQRWSPAHQKPSQQEQTCEMASSPVWRPAAVVPVPTLARACSGVYADVALSASAVACK